jgi:hypothetical protein
VRYDELAPMLLGVVQQQATIAADRAPHRTKRFRHRLELSPN